jgi:hypothetical protein
VEERRRSGWGGVDFMSLLHGTFQLDCSKERKEVGVRSIKEKSDIRVYELLIDKFELFIPRGQDYLQEYRQLFKLCSLRRHWLDVHWVESICLEF